MDYKEQELIDEVTVVVRTIGERTEKKCIERLGEVFGEERVFVIKNITPFSKAMEESYRVGIRENRKWTLIIDADILLWKDRFCLFLRKANEIIKMQNCYCIQPYVYDNFFNRARLAGIHLYSTKLLKQSLIYCDNIALRPETYIERAMANNGFYTYSICVILGIHDYFQSCEDIVKKGILHSKKHTSINSLVDYWEQNCEQNEDYIWILKGVEIGNSLSKDDIKVDNEYFKKIVSKYNITFPKQIEVTDEQIDELLFKLRDEQIYQIVIKQEEIITKNVILKNALLNYSFFSKLKSIKDNAIEHIRDDSNC